MAMPTVSVTAGQTAVAVAGATVLALAGDLLTVNGVSAPIATATASTITLAYGWPGATASASPNWSIGNIAPGWSNGKQTYVAVNDLLDRVSAALPFTPGANGTLAGRAAYDNQPRNFVYLVSDAPWTVYVKRSDTSGDWSPGQAVHNAASTTAESEAARDTAQAAAGTASTQAGIATAQVSAAAASAGQTAADRTATAGNAATATAQAGVASGAAGTATSQAGVASSAAATSTAQASAAAASAGQTAADRAATGADRTQTGADRVATAADRAQTGSDRAAAAASALLAQNTVATGRVAYDTLAQLNANLAPSDGAQGEVGNDGANNGTYRKNGASGSGAWVRTSTSTLPALDALTAFSRAYVTQTDDPAFNFVDEIGNLMARIDGTGGLQAALATITKVVVDQLAVTGGYSISGTTRSGWDFVDELGSVLARIDETGLTVGVLNVVQQLAISGTLSAGSLDLSSVTISSYPDPNVALILTDPVGWVIFAVLTNGKVLCAGVTTPGSSGDYTADELAERNARAVALSAGYRGLLDTTSAAAIWAYNQAFVYGQSLGAGVEGWPAKTLTGRSDVLMVGQSVRPGGGNATTAPAPLGDGAFRPAVATVQDASSGALLTASQQAALAAGDPSLGEEVGVAAILFARRLFLQRAGVKAADDRRFVVSNVAVGGKSIEELSKGASTEYFNRLRVMANAAKSAATAAGGDYGQACVFWLQGEWNYAGTNGSTSKATYKTNAVQLRKDFNADIGTAICGQADMPAWITYQTGGQYTVDATDMSIGQAQWELSQEQTGWYLAAPSYPYTDKNGHLDPNGYRWLAMQMGKVFHETVVLRRRWKPLSPIQATVRGRTVLVDFHLPSGTPLQFQPVYVQSVATSFADRGFTVIDDLGTITLTGVSIVGDALVKISLSRDPVGTVKVSYGRKTVFNGHGNLCDSDPTVAPFTYDYTAGSGDYAAANIPGLVGAAYPLWNWCIAFVLVATPN